MPPSSAAQAYSTLVHIVPASQVRQWAAAGQAVLVDVREAVEFAAEAIPGAVNLPLSGFDVSRVPPVGEGQKLVFFCRSGVRCGTAAEQAMLMGYRGEINRMDGGVFGWKAAGGETR